MSQPIVNSSAYNFSAVHGKDNCKQFSDDTSSIKAVKILGYIVIMIVSFVGNSVIIATVVRNKKMRTTVNYLIANMAASDFLISTFSVPIQLSEIVVGPRRWLMRGTVGLVSCKLAYFLQDVSSTVSIQSLVVIAFDRYRGIAFPFRPAMVTVRRCKIIIPLVWLTSMCLHAIYFYTVRLVSHNGQTYCIFSWTPAFHPQRAQEQYVIVLLVFVVTLPLSIIALFYSRIICSLKKEGTARGSTSSFYRQRHAENTRVFKYIFAIMAAFLFCVLPMYVYGILYFFIWKWKMPCNMEQFGFAAHFILFSNAAITPLINFAFNDRYRKGLKDILKQLKPCHKDDGVNLNEANFELN